MRDTSFFPFVWRPGCVPRRPRRRGGTSGGLIKLGQPLLHQQCWCWGQDVIRPEGNLLLERGFDRLRASGGRGSTAYTLVGTNATIALWGFGAFYGDSENGGMFLRRASFRPKLSDTSVPPRAHQPTDIRDVRVIRTSDDLHRARHLLTAFCGWVASYEEWVSACAGDQHRAMTLERWDHPVIAPQHTAAGWRRLAHSCATGLMP